MTHALAQKAENIGKFEVEMRERSGVVVVYIEDSAASEGSPGGRGRSDGCYGEGRTHGKGGEAPGDVYGDGGCISIGVGGEDVSFMGWSGAGLDLCDTDDADKE
jgi:hypothetical protein